MSGVNGPSGREREGQSAANGPSGPEREGQRAANGPGGGGGGFTAPLARAARQGLDVAVGLVVLGVQQFQVDRPGVERDLRALGLDGLADATGRAGACLGAQVTRLLRPGTPAR